MSLEFENTFIFRRANTTALTQYAVPTFIINANEVDVWVGWSDAVITVHTSMHLEHTLEQGYYFDNSEIPLAKFTWYGGWTDTILPNPPLAPGPMPSLADDSCATKWGNSIFVSRQGVTGEYDVSTKSRIRSINFGSTNIVAANNALWTVGESTLSRYDLATNTPSTYTIPGRHQTTFRDIIDGLDGKVWITCRNEHSIIGFDTTTLSFTPMYKICRHPESLNVNQNKELFASSDPAIIKWDQSTSTATTFAANLGHTTLLDDFRTGYMWLVGGNKPVYRMEKATTDVIEPSVMSTAGSQTGNQFRKTAVLTNAVTYDRYDPTTNTVAPYTIRPYLFMQLSDGIVAYRATALKGVNSSEILGTAMIAKGAQGYYGE